MSWGGLAKFVGYTSVGTLASWGGSVAKAAVTNATANSAAWIQTAAVGAMTYTGIPIFVASGIVVTYAAVETINNYWPTEDDDNSNNDNSSRAVLVGGLIGFLGAIGGEILVNCLSSTSDDVNKTDVARGFGDAALMTIVGGLCGCCTQTGNPRIDAVSMAAGQEANRQYKQMTNQI